MNMSQNVKNLLFTILGGLIVAFIIFLIDAIRYKDRREKEDVYDEKLVEKNREVMKIIDANKDKITNLKDAINQIDGKIQSLGSYFKGKGENMPANVFAYNESENNPKRKEEVKQGIEERVPKISSTQLAEITKLNRKQQKITPVAAPFNDEYILVGISNQEKNSDSSSTELAISDDWNNILVTNDLNMSDLYLVDSKINVGDIAGSKDESVMTFFYQTGTHKDSLWNDDNWSWEIGNSNHITINKDSLYTAQIPVKSDLSINQIIQK